MAWNFSPDRPVYIQLAERIKNSVLSGEYLPDVQIPSVRQLALSAAVNPNTVQHAFSELENEGLIVSKGTLGRFVTNDTEVIENCRKEQAKSLVKSFVKSAKPLSISNEELINMIKEEL